MLTSQEAGQNSLSVEEITKRQIVKLLTPEEVDDNWKDIEKEIDRDPELLLRYYTKDSLFERAMNGMLQVWAVCPPQFGGVFTLMLFSERVQTDTGPQLHVFWASGEGAVGALNLITLVLKRFAAETGCSRMYATGRKGWVRALRAFGAEEEGVCFSVPVERLRSN